MDRIDIETDGASSEAVGELDLAHWPEQTYEVKSRRAVSAHARALLRERALAALGRRRLRRHLSPVQGRARSVRAVRQRAGRRRRLPLSVAVRRPALDAHRLRGDRRRLQVLRRRRAVRLLDRAARIADAVDGAVRRDLHRRRSRADLGFLRARRPAVRRPRDRAQSARLADRALSRAPRRRRGDRRAAAGSRDDEAARSTAAPAADPDPPAQERGPFGAAAARQRTCRSAARSPTASTPTASKPSNGRFATERTHVVVRRRDRLGRRVDVPVPRHQRRLAGERPGARRHPDRLRRAHRAGGRSAAAASSTAA